MRLDIDRTRWSRVRLGDVVSQSREKVDPADGSVERYVAGEHMKTDNLAIESWGEVNDGYLGPAFHCRFRPGQALYGLGPTSLGKVEAAGAAQAGPAPVRRGQHTGRRWHAAGGADPACMWREGQRIRGAGAWRKALGRTRHAQQLRQASPLVTVLPEEARQRILKQIRNLKEGIVIDGTPRTPPDGEGMQETP